MLSKMVRMTQVLELNLKIQVDYWIGCSQVCHPFELVHVQHSQYATVVLVVFKLI